MSEFQPGSTRVILEPIECRILGAMIEKSATTPDIYPMTTNALVAACNQKTNRDPVTDFTAVEIDAALLQMRGRELVRRVHTQGARSTKHRQTLDELLGLSLEHLALLSVLMLRGSQTIGELRLRTERQYVFEDLESVSRTLGELERRSTPLVMQLSRRPREKEPRWVHLLSAPDVDAQVGPAALDPDRGGESGHTRPTSSQPIHKHPTSPSVTSEAPGPSPSPSVTSETPGLSPSPSVTSEAPGLSPSWQAVPASVENAGQSDDAQREPTGPGVYAKDGGFDAETSLRSDDEAGGDLALQRRVSALEHQVATLAAKLDRLIQEWSM